MDFIPRYAQPFTLSEATKLDVSTITDEISRLYNSLQHLKRTQTSLQEYIEAEASQSIDPEIKNAFDENKTVIGSQEERITILKLALSEKGVHFDSHNNFDFGTTARVRASTEDPDADSVEDGLHL